MNKPDTRAVAIGGLVGLVGAAIGLGAGLSLGAVPGGIVGAIAAAAIGAAAGARLLGEPATRGAHSASPFGEGPGPQRGVPATGGHLATRTFAPPGLPDDDHDSEAIRASAREIADAAMGLDESSRRMAEGASDQTGTVTRTTNTVEALSDRIDRISQNAEEAADATQGTRQQAVRGLEQIRGIIQGMDGLRSLVEANARKARRLGERSVEIGAIVRMIDEISSRTDMLALNATIESVRAGEHGRGFAVVAEEIRKLAERSAAATREIGTLVEAIQADAHESVRALAVEEAQMEEETRRVHEAGSALERIHRMAEDSARLVDGISHSANDQVLAARDLVAGMQRIAEVANQTLGETTQIRHETRLLVSLCERVHGLGAGPKPGLGGGPGRGRRPIAAEATP